MSEVTREEFEAFQVDTQAKLAKLSANLAGMAEAINFLDARLSNIMEFEMGEAERRAEKFEKQIEEHQDTGDEYGLGNFQ